MPAVKQKATVDYHANTKQAENALKRLQKKTDDLQKSAAKNAKQGAAVLAGVAAAAGVAVRAYAQQEQAERKVAASIRAVGDSSGLTLEKVKDMASELQRLTVHGDETALAMAGMGIRVANLSEKTMPRFLMASADLATTFDKDINMMSQTLARALADPERGLTQLQRYGVVFSDEQKKLVAEAGTMAEKHAIIMGALEERYGGAAEAAAKGTGKITQLTNKLGDIYEQVGERIFKAIEPIIDALNSWADEAVKAESATVKLIVQVIKLGTAVGTLLTGLAAFKVLAVGWRKVVLATAGAVGLLRKGVLLLTLAVKRIPHIALAMGLGELLWHLPRIIENFDKVKTALVDGLADAFYRVTGFIARKVKNINDMILTVLQTVNKVKGWANNWLPGKFKFDTSSDTGLTGFITQIDKDLEGFLDGWREKGKKAGEEFSRSYTEATSLLTKKKEEDASAGGSDGEDVAEGGAVGIHGVSARERRDQWELEQIRRQNEKKKQEELDAREALEEEMSLKEDEYRALREQNELLGMEDFDLRKQELMHELWMAEKARELAEKQGLSAERLKILDIELATAKKALLLHAKDKKKIDDASLQGRLSTMASELAAGKLFGEKGKSLKKMFALDDLKISIARDAAEAFTKGLANPPGPPFSIGQAVTAAATVVAKGAAGFAGIQSAQMGGRVPGGHSSRDNRLILAQSGEHIVPVGEPWEQVRRGIIRQAEADGEMSSNNNGAGGTQDQPPMQLELVGEAGELFRLVDARDRVRRGA